MNIFRSVLKTKQFPMILLTKALKRALKQYQQGIKKEKSALEHFAEKQAKVIPVKLRNI